MWRQTQLSGVDTEVLMTFYVEDNTSQGKDWIFDSGSTIHVSSHKKMLDPSAIRHHHSQPKRQGNLGRREVWKDIQTEERNSVRGISLEGSSS